jgi:hypothetical protein
MKNTQGALHRKEPMTVLEHRNHHLFGEMQNM